MIVDADGSAASDDTLQFAGSATTRLLFAGPPTELTGMIPLVNQADTKLKLRSLSLESSDLRGAAREPLGEAAFFAKLRPGEQANVPATIVLHPSTPPGRYEFELAIAGRRVGADAHVEEVVDLRLAPSQITILADGATTYTRTFVVENTGNVALPSGESCEAPLFDSVDIEAAIIAGINSSDGSTAETMVRSALRNIGALLAGTLVTRRGSTIVQPGDKVTVDLTFELPAKLQPLRHYFASLQLYNATLFVDIYTTNKYGRGAARPRKAKAKEATP